MPDFLVLVIFMSIVVICATVAHIVELFLISRKNKGE
jgi:hypothetical protein